MNYNKLKNYLQDNNITLPIYCKAVGLTTGGFHQMVRNITKHIYDFKHTGNGMAFDQGFNSRDIQLQNRHSSLDETQRYLNKFRRVASDKFREEFKGY